MTQQKNHGYCQALGPCLFIVARSLVDFGEKGSLLGVFYIGFVPNDLVNQHLIRRIEGIQLQVAMILIDFVTLRCGQHVAQICQSGYWNVCVGRMRSHPVR